VNTTPIFDQNLTTKPNNLRCLYVGEKHHCLTKYMETSKIRVYFLSSNIEFLMYNFEAYTCYWLLENNVHGQGMKTKTENTGKG